MGLVTVVRRAFAVNPQALPVSSRENATLQARGLHEPTLRCYLAWRRSLMLFVVLSTLLSAGLATYRQLTETDERAELFDRIAERFSAQTSTPAPLTPVPLPSGPLPFPPLPAADDAEEDEDDDEVPAAGTSGVSLSASAQSQAEADEDVEDPEEPPPETAFGKFTDFVQLMSLYALPVAALAVVLLWTRLRLSFWIMVAAFTFAFMVPLLIALCPWSWWGYEETVFSPQTQPLQYLEATVEGLLEGTAYLVTLLPTVLSLVPGVQRACVRVKMLMPQAMLPGWFLVVASPFYTLFLLVMFVAVNQVDSHPLFFCGMLLFLLAPLTYAVRTDLVTRPLSSPDDFRWLRAVQRVVGGTTGLAAALLTTYLATREVAGVRLLGLDPARSILGPLDLVEFGLEFLSRSMFVTALGADLFMRMNLAAWRNTQAFAGSPDAAGYDRVMGALERLSSGERSSPTGRPHA